MPVGAQYTGAQSRWRRSVRSSQDLGKQSNKSAEFVQFVNGVILRVSSQKYRYGVSVLAGHLSLKVHRVGLNASLVV